MDSDFKLMVWGFWSSTCSWFLFSLLWWAKGINCELSALVVGRSCAYSRVTLLVSIFFSIISLIVSENKSTDSWSLSDPLPLTFRGYDNERIICCSIVNFRFSLNSALFEVRFFGVFFNCNMMLPSFWSNEVTWGIVFVVVEIVASN